MPRPTFLFEIGAEELPADFVHSALEQWRERIPRSLAEQSLEPEALQFYGSPRRLAVLLTGLPERQPNREEEIKGPPLSAAYQGGEPTPALLGFAKKQGVAVADLEERQTDKGTFLFAHKPLPGQASAELLPQLALTWLQSLEGRRFMRWGDGELRFPRPIRWLTALLDDEVLPLELVNGSSVLQAGRVSQGHRVLHPAPVSLPQAQDYAGALEKAFVLADPQARRALIQTQIQNQARELGGTAEIPPALLEEVTQLVEYPTAVAGQFEADFLRLPPEVITTVMVTHQRYFPVRGGDGALLPYFITVSNGAPAQAKVISEGNERVIRARLADASFFYQADCDQPLESYLPQLETVTFQEELGTMRDKVDRIMELTQAIAEQLQLPEGQRNELESAAMLCKADLVTQMVYEFPELQGVMGQKYAEASGEPLAVSQGIFEHYLPRHQDDDLPASLTGQVVGIADRLDTLISIFGIGLLPTGSSDPFALRRAANAVINILWSAQLDLDLSQLLERGCADFITAHPGRLSPLTHLTAFFSHRLQTLLQDEQGIDYDLVKAVLGDEDVAAQTRALADSLDLLKRARFLRQIRQDNRLQQVYETVNRSTRLAAKGTLPLEVLDPRQAVRPELFAKTSETQVYEALLTLLPQTEATRETQDYDAWFSAFAAITPAVAEFFDGAESVLVMAEEEAIRVNRLNLLGLIRNHARLLADFGAILKP
ncbi:MAG: glycine--tRNA ligase subunit beta [Cyanobacteriota bacterium]|jgi:glycyl-tRNA synthetase beta chain